LFHQDISNSNVKKDIRIVYYIDITYIFGLDKWNEEEEEEEEEGGFDFTSNDETRVFFFFHFVAFLLLFIVNNQITVSNFESLAIIHFSIARL
jgi:hypothetical protein